MCVCVCWWEKNMLKHHLPKISNCCPEIVKFDGGWKKGQQSSEHVIVKTDIAIFMLRVTMRVHALIQLVLLIEIFKS